MVVVVVVACHLGGYLTADRFRIVAAVVVQRSRLVGALEVFHHGTANPLASGCFIGVFHAPQTVPSVAFTHAGSVFEGHVQIRLHLVLFRDVPSYLVGDGAQVVAIYPVLHGVVLEIVLVADGQDDFPESLQVCRLALGSHLLTFAPGTGIGIVRTAKQRHMLNAGGDEDYFLWIAAEVEVLLVVVSPRGVALIDVGSLAEGLLAVAVVHQFSVAAVEVYLQPALGVGHRPEVRRSDVYLRYRLGIGAFGEVPYAEALVAQHLPLFPATHLEEELPPADVAVALLQVRLVVGMYGSHHVDGS